MKRKIFISIITIAIISFVTFYGYSFFEKKQSYNFFAVITINPPSEIRSYLFSHNDFNYYLNGYRGDEVFVLQNDKGIDITDEIISVAKDRIYNNIFTFNDNGVTYRISQLRNALYNYNVDITWVMMKFNFIETEKIKNITNINIMKSENSNKEYAKIYTQKDSDFESNIYINGLSLKEITINNKTDEFISGVKQNNISTDNIINYFIDNYRLVLKTYPNDLNTIDIKEIEVNNINLLIETKIESGTINYYLSTK